MNSESVKKGDRVMLKSGGPVMTVSEEMSSGGLLCQWFNNNKLDQAVFDAEVLRRVPDTT